MKRAYAYSYMLQNVHNNSAHKQVGTYILAYVKIIAQPLILLYNAV